MKRNFGLDPMVVKELSGVSRRWQTYLGRVVYVGLIGLILYFALKETRADLLSNPSEYANVGRMIFYSFLGLQMIFASLTAVSMASDLIAKEVRAGTLGLLSLTPLTPWRIVAGKWKAAMTYVISLVLCGVPVLAICVFLGGVGIWEFTWSLAMTLAASSLSAAIALLYSSVFRAGYIAVIVGIITLAAYTILPLFMLFGIRSSDDGFLQLLYWTHPAYATVGAAMGDRREGSEYGWIGASLCSFFLTWVLLRGAAARVRTLAEAVLAPSALAKTFDAMDRFYEEINPKALKNVKIFAGQGEVWQENAILWKELRTRASGKLRNATRIGLGLLLLVLLPASCAFAGASDWHVPMLWLSSFLLLFMALANGVSLFVKEKEGRQWDVLLSTPLTARQIVSAKLTAGLAALAPLSCILLVLFSLVCFAYGTGLLGCVITLSSVGMIVLFAYAVSAAMSLRAASMRAAFSGAFGILMLILMVLPVILAFYSALPGAHWDRDEFPYVLVTITNPQTFLEPFVTVGRHNYRDSASAYTEVLPYFFSYIFIYGLMTMTALLYMVLRFDRITGRAPVRPDAGG